MEFFFLEILNVSGFFSNIRTVIQCICPCTMYKQLLTNNVGACCGRFHKIQYNVIRRELLMAANLLIVLY